MVEAQGSRLAGRRANEEEKRGIIVGMRSIEWDI